MSSLNTCKILTMTKFGAICILLFSLNACTAAQRSVRLDAQDRSDLAENAELYWRALRWADLPAAASYFADSGVRMNWLNEAQSPNAPRYRTAQVLQVDTSPRHEPDDRGSVREGAVFTQVEYYQMPSQVLVQELVPQHWYQTEFGWFIVPEPEQDQPLHQ
jgi:hypothetical protein